MAKWAHNDVLDGGLLAIKNGAIRMLLLGSYSAGDSYNTVQGNKLCEVTMTSSDFIISTSGTSRLLTTATKSGTATAAASTPNLHIAFIDNVSKVLWVTDETTDLPVSIGLTVDFPAATYASDQPA